MNETRQEKKRLLIEMAVAFGRRLQSSQTGYLHYFYHQQEEKTPSLTIPTKENTLFILALLHSRTVENGIEAKDLLDKLLHFQHAQGNFPIYLHDYPECKDRTLAVRLAVPLFWILKSFSHVLGHELKKRAENALSRVLEYSLSTLKEKPLPYHLSLKVAASAVAGGHLLKQREIEEQGQLLLDELCAVAAPIDWYSPVHLGAILSALQMVYPHLERSPWHHFWRHLENTWHRKSCTYVGPCIEEYQVDFEPQVTLYDLYLGFFSGQFSERSLKPHLVHLEGTLIQSSDDILNSPTYPLRMQGSVRGQAWHLCHGDQFGYSAIEGHLVPSNRGFCPFRLVIGTPQRAHTLVCQGGNAEHIEFQDLEKGILFYLDTPTSVEDREKNRDIIFYFDWDDSTEIWVEDRRATTFTLGERVEIRRAGFILSLIFTLEEGEGRFLGHIMRGNRPSQLSLKGTKRFNAYDWQLFLRTVHRAAPCTVRVSVIFHY
jgi:hypothetical protein